MTILVSLYGGLGNQMFQYALARQLSILNYSIVKLDVSYFDNQTFDTLRHFGLSHFNILQQIATKEEIQAFFPEHPKENFKQRCQRKLHQILKVKDTEPHSISSSIVCREAHYNFDATVLNLRGNIYLDGYWQSEKYFSKIRSLLLKEFTVRYPLDDEDKIIVEKIRNTNSVAVHIRRGDYLTNKKAYQAHGICPIDYYNKAIEYIAERLENVHLYIFSDDFKWVTSNLAYSFPITYIDHNQDFDFEDLRLMALCQHQVIANSSFSWWGAWLNRNLNKIVVAPKQWFNQLDWNTSDLLPNNWIKL